MARGFQGVVMRGLGARDHEATVIGTRWVTPGLVRIQMVSPTIFEDSQAEPTSWLRFWFPDPDGTDAEYQRAYTITESDVDAGEFAIDVVLHEPSGPASTWARTVAPGATISVMSMGSKGFTVPVDAADRPAGYLLIGDPASTPAINGIIGAVPHDIPIEAYLEDRGDGHVPIPLAEHPQLTVHRVDRRDPGALAAAIEARDWSNWYAWAGPEAGALKHVRNRLREYGFPKREVHAQAYWSERRAMGTKRGTEIQEVATVGAEATAAPIEPEPSGGGRTPTVGVLQSITSWLRRCGWPASTK